MTTFYELLTHSQLLQNLDELQYFEATEIQAKAIPVVKQGKDLFGIAQTGTGKTASFCLPLIENLLKQSHLPESPYSLILVPTRELCLQVHDNILKFANGTGIKSVAIYGGVKQIYQAQEINAGVHFIVATPGRLLDLLRKELISLSEIEVLILDEADRMLDMGFRDDLNLILKNLTDRSQTLFYSATASEAVRELTGAILTHPEFIEVIKEVMIPDNISQIVYECHAQEKLHLLKKIISEDAYGAVLVFTNTKKTADEVAEYLNRNHMETRAIHSDKKQSDRDRSIALFTSGELNVLVATDLVGRGIDVDLVAFVINFDMPLEPEIYIHRIGRTGRAERRGTAISLCLKTEKKCLEAIETSLGIQISLQKRDV